MPYIGPAKYINTKSRPSWSPDSRRVAVSLGNQSYVMDTERNRLQQLGSPGKWTSSPTFDTDSNSVVYSSFGVATVLHTFSMS